MLVVVAAADPEPRTRLIDRYLVAAFDAGLDPILCITKTDLADPAPFLEHFACLDLRIVTSRSDDVPFDALHEVLDDRVTVTVGHSGVGKSTLVNAITGATRATGHVNAVTGGGATRRRRRSPARAGRWVDHRHPGGPVVRSRPRRPRERLPGVRRTRGAGAGARRRHPAAQAHDWEIVDRVADGELGPTGSSGSTRSVRC